MGIAVRHVKILSGQSLSDVLDCEGFRVVGIIMPSAWTAADLTFQISPDNKQNYSSLYDGLGASGNEIVVRATTSRHIALATDDFEGFSYLKVRSGTQSLPVNQGADRTIGVVLRDI